MQKSSYEKYALEAQSWLHRGRKALIQKVLQYHLRNKKGKLEILEVGAGVGQNIDVLRKFGTVDAMECDSIGISYLQKKNGIRQIFDKKLPMNTDQSWDVICVFDVIEHIEQDKDAVHSIFNCLKPGGLFLATVPAFNWLFSEHDKALGHFRRYSHHEFKSLLPEHSTILSCSYFNVLLFPVALIVRFSWQLSKKIIKPKEIVKQSVPTNKYLDTLLWWIIKFEVKIMKIQRKWPFGLSYYLCAKKRIN
jgi:2-polyprenyl-3-methyl-5-hydroxy-6-metoxy-1,4-benzoquinol methylase